MCDKSRSSYIFRDLVLEVALRYLCFLLLVKVVIGLFRVGGGKYICFFMARLRGIGAGISGVRFFEGRYFYSLF